MTKSQHQHAAGRAKARRFVVASAVGASRFAPWFTVTILAALSFALPNRSVESDAAREHKANVARAIQTLPYFVVADDGAFWVAEDAADQIPREAQQLLRPNAIFSRTYSCAGRAPVHVLIVHCGDARDMAGHYPPICYPSSGWISQSPDAEPIHLLHMPGHDMAVREYRFSRPRDQLASDRLRVLNAFILPDGRVTTDFEDITRQTERLAMASRGVAQVQLISSAAVPTEAALQSASELLQVMTPMFDALGVSMRPKASLEEATDDFP